MWTKMNVVRLILGLALASIVFPAEAVYTLKTEAAFWKIGRYDQKLSTKCQFNTFNIDQHKAIVAYQGKKGYGGTSVGLKGWNLYDPLGLAREGMAYHFWHHGLSDCRVYVEPIRKGRRR